ncbi:GAF domain-containing sensor histidine kinase [Geitlerinema sp. P-1104]|uniref:GAF domain-containing sensor histidine kinase n=1 Tax=Geitlerinema sp. P-1104 TaxID=2546230 RepID=UPI0014778311|nr:GAF domain-containing sensor histidine kinase [Geitlerinema sp. P-1104]
MSSELMLLCQEQVALLENTLGASPVVVYLAETFLGGNDHKLVPAIAKPDRRVAWDEVSVRSDRHSRAPQIQLRSAEPNRPDTVILSSVGHLLPQQEEDPSPDEELPIEDEEDPQSYQLVMPIMHDNIAVGLLVTARADKPWSEGDRSLVEQIAHTMAIACIMEQRQQWTERSYRQQKQLQIQQHDLLHDWLHQFRNPLTALQIFGKLLVKQLPSDDPRRSYADSILRESHRLQDLFQDFRGAIDADPFLLPQASDGDPPNPDSPASAEAPSALPLLPGSPEDNRSLNLGEILDPLLSSASTLAQERHVNLEVQCCDTLPPIQGNRRSLVEAAGNLIDNALKYTPAGGEIAVDVRPSSQPELGDGVAVTISDSGVGIPPEDQTKLFQRRFRGVQAEGEIPGTGLGLAIARDLVRQMGGDIWVTSPPQHPNPSFESDRGSSFVLWLPQAEAPPDS